MTAVPGQCSLWLFINHACCLENAMYSPPAPERECVSRASSQVPPQCQPLLQIQASKPHLIPAPVLELRKCQQLDQDLERCGKHWCQTPSRCRTKRDLQNDMGLAWVWSYTRKPIPTLQGDLVSVPPLIKWSLYHFYHTGCWENRVLRHYMDALNTALVLYSLLELAHLVCTCVLPNFRDLPIKKLRCVVTCSTASCLRLYAHSLH